MFIIRIILFFIFFNSCDIGKEIDFSDPSPELAFPLGNAVFEPASFLLNLKLPATFTTDANGFITFSYTTVLQEVNALQFTGEIDALLPSLIPISQNNLILPISLPNGIDPVSVQFGGGDLQWFFENSFPEPLDLTLKLPFTDSLNNQLFQTITLPAYSGTGLKPSATNALNPLFLSGKFLIIKDKKISLSYEAKGRSGKLFTLSNAAIRLSKPTWKVIKASFNQYELDFGTIEKSLDFLKPFYASDLNFDRPEVQLFFEHNFLIPIQFSIPSIIISLPDGKKESLIAFNNNQIFNLGISTSSQLKRRDSAVSITSPNPVKTIFEKKANALNFRLTAGLNTKNLPNGLGSINRNDKLSVSAKITIPLAGKLRNYPLSDTIPLNLGLLEKVKKGTVRIISTNSIPMSIYGQCYFMDDKGNKLDSLMTGGPGIISNAKTSSSLNTTAEIFDFPISESQMKALRASDRFIISAFLSTLKNEKEFIEIKKGQQLSMNLSLQATY
jgi:hypothetical protein